MYDHVPCPVHVAVAERSVYPRDGLAAFARRHPRLPITAFPTSQDIEAEAPTALAALILEVVAAVRPE